MSQRLYFSVRLNVIICSLTTAVYGVCTGVACVHNESQLFSCSQWSVATQLRTQGHSRSHCRRVISARSILYGLSRNKYFFDAFSVGRMLLSLIICVIIVVIIAGSEAKFHITVLLSSITWLLVTCKKCVILCIYNVCTILLIWCYILGSAFVQASVLLAKTTLFNIGVCTYNP